MVWIIKSDATPKSTKRELRALGKARWVWIGTNSDPDLDAASGRSATDLPWGFESAIDLLRLNDELSAAADA
eukprot:1365998-Amorphochlora_amoeboformis.AAC.1